MDQWATTGQLGYEATGL